MRNPLDTGEVFDLALMNPNPTSSKTKDGPIYRVSFEMEQEQWQHFMDASTKGMLIAAKAKVVEDGQFLEPEAEKSATQRHEGRAYGQYAKKLHQSGFLVNPDLLRLLGGSRGDQDYEEWVRRQPCLICGQGDYDENGDMRNEPAHILTVEAAPAREGKHPNKPPFWQVPMCHHHHALQHNKGYTAALFERNRIKGVTTPGESPDHRNPNAKEWFINRRNEYVTTWVKLHLYRLFGVDSLTKIPPHDLFQWASQNRLAKWLPAEYKP